MQDEGTDLETVALEASCGSKAAISQNRVIQNYLNYTKKYLLQDQQTFLNAHQRKVSGLMHRRGWDNAMGEVVCRTIRQKAWDDYNFFVGVDKVKPGADVHESVSDETILPVKTVFGLTGKKDLKVLDTRIGLQRDLTSATLPGLASEKALQKLYVRSGDFKLLKRPSKSQEPFQRLLVQGQKAKKLLIKDNVQSRQAAMDRFDDTVDNWNKQNSLNRAHEVITKKYPSITNAPRGTKTGLKTILDMFSQENILEFCGADVALNTDENLDIELSDGEIDQVVNAGPWSPQRTVTFAMTRPATAEDVIGTQMNSAYSSMSHSMRDQSGKDSARKKPVLFEAEENAPRYTMHSSRSSVASDYTEESTPIYRMRPKNTIYTAMDREMNSFVEKYRNSLHSDALDFYLHRNRKVGQIFGHPPPEHQIFRSRSRIVKREVGRIPAEVEFMQSEQQGAKLEMKVEKAVRERKRILLEKRKYFEEKNYWETEKAKAIATKKKEEQEEKRRSLYEKQGKPYLPPKDGLDVATRNSFPEVNFGLDAIKKSEEELRHKQQLEKEREKKCPAGILDVMFEAQPELISQWHNNKKKTKPIISQPTTKKGQFLPRFDVKPKVHDFAEATDTDNKSSAMPADKDSTDKLAQGKTQRRPTLTSLTKSTPRQKNVGRATAQRKTVKPKHYYKTKFHTKSATDKLGWYFPEKYCKEQNLPRLKVIKDATKGEELQEVSEAGVDEQDEDVPGELPSDNKEQVAYRDMLLQEEMLRQEAEAKAEAENTLTSEKLSHEDIEHEHTLPESTLEIFKMAQSSGHHLVAILQEADNDTEEKFRANEHVGLVASSLLPEVRRSHAVARQDNGEEHNENRKSNSPPKSSQWIAVVPHRTETQEKQQTNDRPGYKPSMYEGLVKPSMYESLVKPSMYESLVKPPDEGFNTLAAGKKLDDCNLMPEDREFVFQVLQQRNMHHDRAKRMADLGKSKMPVAVGHRNAATYLTTAIKDFIHRAEAKKIRMDYGDTSPLEMLMCRYLRLNQPVIEELMQMAREEGIELNIHAHVTEEMVLLDLLQPYEKLEYSREQIMSFIHDHPAYDSEPTNKKSTSLISHIVNCYQTMRNRIHRKFGVTDDKPGSLAEVVSDNTPLGQQLCKTDAGSVPRRRARNAQDMGLVKVRQSVLPSTITDLFQVDAFPSA